MTSHISTDAKANLIGSLWMIAAMAGFAVEDAFAKAASKALPVGEVLILFGIGGAIVFTSIAHFQGVRLYSADVISRPMRIRVLFEIFGRLFYMLAIALTPLSSATAILQATPIFVVAGAAMFFGERVGWRRWTAIVVGLIGVLIIIRPTSDGFSMLSILAFLGMLGFAGRDLASRAAPPSLDTSILGLYGFLAVIVAGGIFSIWEGTLLILPDMRSALLLLGIILAGTAAYASLMKAMRTGEVSTVTPFRYSRLLFGTASGILLFNEQLNLAMLIGCVLIITSGLYIFWRGNHEKKQQTLQSSGT